jgi:arabinofuranosyltransferase
MTPPMQPAGNSNTTYPTWHTVVLSVFLSITVISLLFNSWTSDDAFFTFRVVDNFIHGFGLRYNVFDRVQVYTNPLWMMVHVPFSMVFDNIAYITLGISFACALASIWLVIRASNLPPLYTAVFFLLPFALSKTITQYFSSGLENPMTSFMFAWFFYELLTHEKPRFFWLTLIASLSMLNRMDTAVAYAPMMLFLAWQHRRNLPFKEIFTGMIPILGWMVFSLFYYGFIFPNTMYAKVGAELPVANYIKVGLYYVAEYAMADPMIAGILIYMIALTWTSHFRRFLRSPDNYDHARVFFLGVGMTLYSLYVIRVGGSYITCLFMSLPSFMALCLFAFTVPGRYERIGLSALVALCGLFIATDSLAETSFWNHLRMPIARKYKVSNFKPEFLLDFDKNNYSITLNKFEKHFERCEDSVFIMHGKGGRGSYYGSWCRHQMGKYALGDALLAHLPSAIPHIGRISHIPRSLPDGYTHALETNDLSQMHPMLQEYYRPLHFIIRGDLWSWERLVTIVKFNLGLYDHWKYAYLQDMEAACAPDCKHVATGWPDNTDKKANRRRQREKRKQENEEPEFDPDD